MQTALDTTHADVRELITKVAEEIGYDAWYTHVEEIPSEPYSGFIPFTDGGFDGVVTFGLYDEAAYACSLIAPIVDRDYAWRDETWREQEGIDADAEIPDTPEWEDFRSEWEQGDPTSWFVKARAIYYTSDNRRNMSGEDEYLFCLGICDDLNYGRDKVGAWAGNIGTHWVWERNIAASELNAEVLAEISVAMLAAWIAS